MAHPTEGRFARPERRLGCRHGTPSTLTRRRFRVPTSTPT